MQYPINEEGPFRYVELGQGQPIVLLHGLFGALSNWHGVVDHFSKSYKVVIPLLPLYTLPMEQSTVTGMAQHVHDFLDFMGYRSPIFVGNSLGGHIALVYALMYAGEDDVKAIVLTASSGLFEDSLGGSMPRRGDNDYIRRKAGETFYDPTLVTDELVDELRFITTSREHAFRVITMSKSAMRENLADKLQDVTVPVQLIWGRNDTITPPHVAEKFHELLPNSRLDWIDKCGHAPMMERPEEFNRLFDQFLHGLLSPHAAPSQDSAPAKA